MNIYVPKVKEVTMFKEIALNIKNPCEIIREGISNSYDSDAKNIWITIKRNIDGDLEIKMRDDGEGMDLNEIHSFFNLCDSKKMIQSIGEKGLGTKIYFKSKEIAINTKKINDKGYNVIMDKPWDEQFYHYHLLANSQNFVLTADRNSLSNSETIAVKWIFEEIQDIFRNEIKPIAEKEYFFMRKEEEEAYDSECRISAMNKYIKKLDLIDNLYIKDIPIKKVPQGEYEVALLFASILSNIYTKSLINDIKNIISYSSRMTTDVI